MYPLYVDTEFSITLVGGSDVAPETIHQLLQYAPILVAADGGVQAALGIGQLPKAIIGDFDSIDPNILAQVPAEHLFHLSEQNSTDFDKCLRSIRAPLILAVGFTGGRLDHELAVYNALLRHPDKACIVLGEVDLCFLAPQNLRLQLPVGTRVSLFPFAPCQVEATGLRWPVNGLDMAPDGLIGTSNEASTPEVVLEVSERKLLVVLPQEHLKAVMAALV